MAQQQSASLGFGQAAGKGEADAVACRAGRAADEQLLRRVDASLVGDVEGQRVRGVAGLDGHGAASMPQCVVHEHVQNLADGRCRRGGRRQVGGDADAQAAPDVGEGRVVIAAQLVEQRGQRQFLIAVREVAGERQQVIHRAFEAVGGRDGGGDRLPHLDGVLQRGLELEAQPGEWGA